MATDLSGLFGPADMPQPAAPPVPPAPPPQPEPPPAVPAVPETAQVSTLRQARAALATAYFKGRRTWRDARNHHGGPIWKIEHYQPPSISGQIAYRDGRGWVPDSHHGGWADEWGVRYHTWIAIPVMIPAVILIYLVTSPYRMGVAALIAIVTGAFVWALFHFGVLF